MKIAIDIDDTLTNSFDYFMPYVAEFFNVDLSYLKTNNISFSNFPNDWKQYELDFCKKYYDNIVVDTPFKKDAIKIVNQLKKEGHKIYILTARTNDFYTNPVKTTKEELDKNKILYDELICSFDKAKHCQDNNIDLFIDDSYSNCEKVNSLKIKTLLFNSPANKDINTNIERVDNWNYIYNKIKWIERGYPNRKEAEKLLTDAEMLNTGKWVAHSRIVAKCAEQIALYCNLDSEKAYVLGLLHDIGRRFGTKHLGHIYDGYKYMLELGYKDVAKICLSHSFPTQNLKIYLGNFDIEKEEQQELEYEINHIIFDDYDKLIQLCDSIGSADGVVDMELRMQDVKKRYGNYPQEQWNKNIELKKYFESKIKKNIYEVCK